MFKRNGAVISYTDADIAERVAMIKQPSLDDRVKKLESTLDKILMLLERPNESVGKD